MSNPNHDPSNGEFSSGGGAGSPVMHGAAQFEAQKAHARATLKEVHVEHQRLAGALKAGNIDSAGLDKLEAINKFVLKNAATIKTLK